MLLLLVLLVGLRPASPYCCMQASMYYIPEPTTAWKRPLSQRAEIVGTSLLPLLMCKGGGFLAGVDGALVTQRIQDVLRFEYSHDACSDLWACQYSQHPKRYFEVVRELQERDLVLPPSRPTPLLGSQAWKARAAAGVVFQTCLPLFAPLGNAGNATRSALHGPGGGCRKSLEA